MKRMISMILSVLLAIGCFVCLLSPAAAAKDENDTAVISVENEGKKTRLLLKWTGVFQADGVQIFRSGSGKKGSYEKIASVRGKTYYRDNGLSANHIYYYKLRPFLKTEQGYHFGSYRTAIGATAVTQSFLKKQLNAALAAAHQWLDTAMLRCKNGKSIVRTTETDDGLVTGTFREINSGSVRSAAKLKKYLCRFFSRDFVESFVNAYYYEEDGKLYLLEGESPDASYYVLDQTTLKNVSQNGTAVSFDAVLRRPDFNQQKSTFAASWFGLTGKQKRNAQTGRIIVNLNEADWNLTLVNKTRELPQGFVPQTSEILHTGYVLDARVTPHYEEMYRAAAQDGCYLTPYSTYRSYDHQNYLFQNKYKELRSSGYSAERAQEYTAAQILYPGTSEHQLGLAADIRGTGQWFAQTKEYAWLLEHAHEYGFILRYTAEKQPITGIVPEPWHWRYVGVENAEKIKNSGLCLEEYLDSIGVAY